MKTDTAIYEEITIYHSDKEHDAAYALVDGEGWLVRDIGPLVVRGLRAKRRFKIVAYRQITASSVAVRKFKSRRRA